MKILIVPNNMENNCYGVRNKLPAKFLKERGHEVWIKNDWNVVTTKDGRRGFDPTPIDWCDTVVFNRHYDIDTASLRNLMEYAKGTGKKVVYETDDLLESLNFSNPMYQDIQRHVSQVRMMSSTASICTTTGEEIKNELSKYNENVHILPNCVNPEEWTPRKGRNRKVKVGYAGGSSHNEDIMLILDVVRDLQKEIDFEFTIFGLAPIPWKKYIERTKGHHQEALKNNPNAHAADWYLRTMEIDDKLKEIKWKHQPFVPIEQYNETLAKLNFDIGICPLIDNRFNRCKSAIKFYEYAMVGTATLASKIPPYKDEVNYTAKNQYDKWKSKLKALIEDKQLRQTITKQQREWVLENRDIRKNVHLWEKAYN